MSDQSGTGRKRSAAEDEDAQQGEPLYADAETMAKRRIVRVARPTQTGPPPSLGGAFKSLPNVGPVGAPALSTKFGFTDGNGLDGETATSSKSDAPFSFEPKSTGNFSSLLSSSLFGGKLAVGTSHTAPDAPAPAADNANSDKKQEGNGEGPATKTLFGGSFNFSNAVNSFAAAKERISRASEEDQIGRSDMNNPVVPAPSEVLANTAPVSPPAGDVIASVSCKLYLFKPETKSWSDCGTGDAKIKRHALPVSEGDAEGSSKFCYRLIVRDGYALNALICDNFTLTKTEDSHAIVSFFIDGKPATYLLKYAGPQATEHGPAFSEKLKEALKAAGGKS
uniref:RanBD1 domain-containing protein n=1 Tax=Trypanosoma congolense (strain IL3000) TaxID=1068625 RepID=G0UX53_TRYCI|nr:conserved hypothetical protein [Trypanosoma congolense IL3000]